MNVTDAIMAAAGSEVARNYDKHSQPIAFIMASAKAKDSKYLFTGDNHHGWMFGYTTYRLADGTFAAVILKPGSTANDPILAKVKWFAKRSSAKAQAMRWAEMTRQATSGRPPASILK